MKSFLEANDTSSFLNKKRKVEEESASTDQKLPGSGKDTEYQAQRRKLIDDTEQEIRLEELRKVSPWIPQFTPEAKESAVAEPPKRPLSPFSGQPLRSKDLIPIHLIKEPVTSSTEGVKFICPVSRYVSFFRTNYLSDHLGKQ